MTDQVPEQMEPTDNLNLSDVRISKTGVFGGETWVNTEFLNRAVATECRRVRAETIKEMLERLDDYVVHTDRCILSCWEAGEPTPDGGYRSKFAGKWYQSKPVDETPKCNCGLDEVFKSELMKEEKPRGEE